MLLEVPDKYSVLVIMWPFLSLMHWLLRIMPVIYSTSLLTTAFCQINIICKGQQPSKIWFHLSHSQIIPCLIKGSSDREVLKRILTLQSLSLGVAYLSYLEVPTFSWCKPSPCPRGRDLLQIMRNEEDSF